MSDTPIRSARFRAEREADWRRLEDLLDRVEARGLGALDFEETAALTTLYRELLSSLTLARTISLDGALLAYLEALAVRAYLAVHAPRLRLTGLVGRLIRGIPPAVRRSWVAILMATLAMALGALAGFALYLDDPLWYNTVMPEGLAAGRGIDSTRDELAAILYAEPAGLSDLAAFSSQLFAHNARIAILVFGLGVLACLPALGLTFWNGMILGVFWGLHADRGLAPDLFGWLSIHGVTELAAIVIACAGGCRMGLALLVPGALGRRAALRAAGRDAVKLALCAALMLIAAAVLEGVFRQTVQDTATRIAIGWGAGAAWALYLLLGGRRG